MAKQQLRVHLTNVQGLGAVQLVSNLLPALERASNAEIEEIYVPGDGVLAGYRRSSEGPAPIRYRRYLPNALSRFLECNVLASAFDGNSPLLVLGDIPIRCRGPQVVFVQTPNLVKNPSTIGAGGAKYAVSRLLFETNLNRAASLVVQTPAMQVALEASYPECSGRIHVIAQPVPSWLEGARGRRRGRSDNTRAKLKLIYPAGDYPHKNHRLLRRLPSQSGREWPVESLALTINVERTPNPSAPWVQCLGVLPPEGMQRLYDGADALLFLSNAESYGFPLLEAMWVGLPVVCPDLPYARALCGEQAIYFKNNDPEALLAAVSELAKRIREGWWPDWTEMLSQIPSSWDDVVQRFLAVVADAVSS